MSPLMILVLLTLPPSLKSLGKKHKIEAFAENLAPIAQAAVRIGGKTHLVDGEKLTEIGDVDLRALERLAALGTGGTNVYVKDGLDCVKKRLGKTKVNPPDEIPTAAVRIEQSMAYFEVASDELALVWSTAKGCGLAVTQGTESPILVKRAKPGKR